LSKTLATAGSLAGNRNRREVLLNGQWLGLSELPAERVDEAAADVRPQSLGF
jgi:hypothetical protein